MAVAEDEVLDDRSLSESMDADIRATLADINARNAAETPEPEEIVAPTAETVAPVADRARDESGKFAKPATEKLAEAAPNEPEQPEALVTTTGHPIDITRAPSSWKPAAKAAWGALPEPVRAEIYRREGNFLNDNSGMRENADFGQSIRSKFEPYRMLMEAEGATPEAAIDQYLRTSATFRVGTPQQKLAALKAIDTQFNCGLNDDFRRAVQTEVARITGNPNAGNPNAAPQQPAPQQVFQDPRVDQLLASIQKREREQAQTEETASNSSIEKFISAKDAKGEPLYPFVDNVLEDLVSRVAQIRTANPNLSRDDILKQGYEAAVWANPETRAVLIAQQQAQTTQSAETLRKVDQAKRASAVNVPKRGALPATGAPLSLDDSIRETGRALGMF